MYAELCICVVSGVCIGKIENQLSHETITVNIYRYRYIAIAHNSLFIFVQSEENYFSKEKITTTTVLFTVIVCM